MHVDPSPLLLRYGAPPGGRRGTMAEDFHRNNIEQVLLAYKAPQGASRLKINARVTTQHIYGKAGSDPVAAIQCMDDLTLPQGAPNGGAKVAFPPRALQYLVNR